MVGTMSTTNQRDVVAHCADPLAREPRALGHIPALDGLRGVAILLVLWSHSFGPPGAGLGVDLFFCLSGFLITALLLAEWHQRGAISLVSFYERRARRLLPALLLLVVVFVAVAPSTRNLFAAAVGVGYVGNVALLTGHDISPFTHLWSLAQEEQFYVLWPFALIVAMRLAPRLLPYVLAALFLATSLDAATASTYERLWYGPDTHAGGLILGALAAVLYVRRADRRVPVGIAALVALGCVMLFQTPTARFVLPVFALAATALVVAAAQDSSRLFTRTLAFRPLRYLGRISYSVYLWHPLFLAIGWEVGIPISVACAAASYHVVEQPFLRMRRRQLPRVRMSPSPAAAATVAGG
jgi:peptidoglycan/LPS O-acetylase OafA/YrhL